MSRYFSLLALFLAAMPQLVEAAQVTIDLRGRDGQPLTDAVVVLDVPGSPRAVPTGSYVMEQRNIAFQPHILIVPVGATVSLPNRDAVRHHVYSFSKAKKFDLKLYGKDDQRSIVFDKPGVVALGCNIHDTMSGFIFVTSSRYAMRSDARGRVRFDDVLASKATISVWSPSIRAPGNMLTQPFLIPAGGTATTLTMPR